ncbi:MAG: hypothetical protein LUG60_08300 [Erysipelotrichaceae bacterium]|nr:hypothetical protein [Erysipelotrichaceae bacterium]
MLVILKENVLKTDIDRLLNIVRKYEIEMIHGSCFELPNDVLLTDLDVLEHDQSVDKIVFEDYVSVEKIVNTYGLLSE